MGANLNIELNNMEVLSDAVDSMIEKLDRQSPVLYWLLEYIEERIADDKRWNVSGEIKNFGRNIFDEGYIEKGNGLREKLRDKDCIKNYRKTLQAIFGRGKLRHLQHPLKRIGQVVHQDIEFFMMTEAEKPVRLWIPNQWISSG